MVLDWHVVKFDDEFLTVGVTSVGTDPIDPRYSVGRFVERGPRHPVAALRYWGTKIGFLAANGSQRGHR